MPHRPRARIAREAARLAARAVLLAALVAAVATAQSDGGRIVAVRNKPGRMSSFSWFKIWEPDGTSTVEGPLNAPSGWSTYTYPLGFDTDPAAARRPWRGRAARPRPSSWW